MHTNSTHSLSVACFIRKNRKDRKRTGKDRNRAGTRTGKTGTRTGNTGAGPEQTGSRGEYRTGGTLLPGALT